VRLEYFKLSSRPTLDCQGIASSSYCSICFNENAGVLQILLRKKDVGLSDESVEFRGRQFEPKEEVHITIIGRALGQQVKKAIEENASVESQAKQAIAETDWTYEIKDRMYHVSKDKRIENPDGGSKVIHAESIIVIAEVAGIRDFYEKLSRIIQTNLEVPPTHVTLYTYGDPDGIGLDNHADFERFVTRKVLPGELNTLEASHQCPSGIRHEVKEVAGPAMVGGTVAYPAPTTEPDVALE
jgi:hypothetical protein